MLQGYHAFLYVEVILSLLKFSWSCQDCCSASVTYGHRNELLSIALYRYGKVCLFISSVNYPQSPWTFMLLTANVSNAPLIISQCLVVLEVAISKSLTNEIPLFGGCLKRDAKTFLDYMNRAGLLDSAHRFLNFINSDITSHLFDNVDHPQVDYSEGVRVSL